MNQDSILTARILVQTLWLTRNNRAVDTSEIAEAAGTTLESVENALDSSLGFQNTPNRHFESFERFKLALEASRLGALSDAAKGLTWQEFEAFGEECLSRSGFQTKKGVVLKDEKRRWQIDIVARKTQMVLAFDCKHWDSPSYPSKFNNAAVHQKNALSVLMRQRDQVSMQPDWGLPVILTLHDPRSPIHDSVVIVSVGQLSDFVSHLSPYDPGLPFVSSELAESPISQRNDDANQR